MKPFTHLYLSLWVLLAGAYAPALLAADAPIVREVFTCSFHDGKDMGDLMTARDFYLKQMEKAGQKPGEAFVWTPFKAPVDFDFLWFNSQGSLPDYAEGADAFNESAEGQAAMERFATVASCTSSLAMRRQIYQADGELTPGVSGAVINSLACNYRRGHGPDDLADLTGHVAGVINSLGLNDGSAGYVSVPTVGVGPDTRDVYFYGVSSSMKAWAKRTMTFQAAEGYASMSRHFQTILDCSNAMFLGQRVVPPAE